MTPEQVVDFIRLMLFVTLEVSGPLLLILFVIGLTIALFQSLTQITEITLVFIPKLIGFVITLAFVFPWMLKIMIHFTHLLLVDRWNEVILQAIHR